MFGQCRGRARKSWARRGPVALAVLLIVSILLSAVSTAVQPFSARAQSEGNWVDPLADAQMTDISANVDETIADVWNGSANDGFVETAPMDPAPVESSPMYAATGLYFDEVGNLIDPATGMAVAYDANGQVVTQGQAAAPDETIDGSETAA